MILLKKHLLIFALFGLLLFPHFVFAVGEPVIINGTPTNVAQTSITLNGEITDEGSAPVIGIWAEYGLDNTYGNEVQRFNLNELTLPGTFDVNITGLTCGTTYHYRFRARNNALLDGYSPDDTFTTAPCDEAPSVFEGGDGTAETPYQITTCEQLQAINDDLDAYYELISDVDCSDTVNWNLNLEEWVDGDTDNGLIPDPYTGVTNNGYFGFEPIGQADFENAGQGFTGSFDGNGYTISDVWIFRKEQQNVGIFGYATGAIISDLGLGNVRVVGGPDTGGLLGNGEGVMIQNVTSINGMVRAYLSYRGGGIAGSLTSDNLDNQSTLDSVQVAGGNVHGSGNMIGGLVGGISDTLVSNSQTSADVDGGEYIGGAFGYISGDVTIQNVEATGNVLGNREDDLYIEGFSKNGRYIGGLIGYAYTVTITQSSASGTVESEGDYAGGFMGYGLSAIISESSAHGSVTAEGNYVGGFIGAGESIDFTDVYAGGDVVAGDYVGGFAGSLFDPTIENAYSRGAVSAVESAEYVGGFAGEVTGQVILLANSFFDDTTSGQESVCGTGDCSGVIALTTLEAKIESTYTDAGWDFDDVWIINHDVNYGYPYFQWETLEQTPSEYELLSLSADDITQSSATLRGQVITGVFPQNGLGFAFSYQPIDSLLGEGVTLIGPADLLGIIDEETGIYTLDLILASDPDIYGDTAVLSCGTTYYYVAIGFTENGEFNSLILADNEISFTTPDCEDDVDISEAPEPSSGGQSSGGSASARFLAQKGILLNPKSVFLNNSPVKNQNHVCPADQLLTQNLRAPSRNGSFNSYTQDTVKEIAILQTHLNRLGFNAGPIDGIAGPLTDGAIKRMQTFLGTQPDGMVGPITRGLINSSCGKEGLEN